MDFFRVPLYISLLLLPALLGGCAGFAPEFQALPSEAMPGSYAPSPYPADASLDTAASPLPAEAPGTTRWWLNFGRDDLTRLEDQALSGNFDLAQAWRRMMQAEATARKSGASLLPSLSYSSDSSTSLKQSQPQRSGSPSTADSQSYGLKLSASFEVDLWGRLGAMRDADLASYAASREDLLTALTTVSGSVAETWVDILAARASMNVLARQTEISRAILDLQQVRFANGQASGLDLLQQQEQFLRTEAELPLLQMQEKNLLDTLAVLLGRLPGKQVPGVEGNTLPELPPPPALGLPADLLLNRPDIRAAALRLNATDRSLAAAKATLLPSLNLSASSAFSSGALDLLFQNWVMNLVAGLTGPIFDGGSRSADIDRQRAAAEERAFAYAQTVANALREVENALTTQQGRQLYLERLKLQLQYARIAEEEARQRYFNGQETFSVYISEVQNVQSLERSLVTEQATILKQRIALYRALGGSWSASALSEGALPPQTPPQGA